MDKIIGTCDQCNGPVVVPEVYHSVNPPTPRCKACGATATQGYGPKVAMTPARRSSTGSVLEELFEGAVSLLSD